MNGSKYKNFIYASLLLFFSCSHSPTEQEKPQPVEYIPDWESGKSVVLNYLWVDTNGNGEANYYGNSVTISGRLDSIWFNFPEPCNKLMDFNVVADFEPYYDENDSLITPETQVIYSGTITEGHYLYGYEINHTIDMSCQYAVYLISAGNFPMPVKGYMRLEY